MNKNDGVGQWLWGIGMHIVWFWVLETRYIKFKMWIYNWCLDRGKSQIEGVGISFGRFFFKNLVDFGVSLISFWTI